jgi:hypothetical protein
MIVSGTTSEEYVHNQAIPSAAWIIEHNLGGYPSITVIDSANSQVEGDVVFDSTNQITVSFSSAFSGKAVCR